jgi:hypothetical protein
VSPRRDSGGSQPDGRDMASEALPDAVAEELEALTYIYGEALVGNPSNPREFAVTVVPTTGGDSTTNRVSAVLRFQLPAGYPNEAARVRIESATLQQPQVGS